MYKSSIVKILLIFIMIHFVYAGNIKKYGAVNNVTAMAQLGDTIFLATQGGLALYSKSLDTIVSQEHDVDEITDISLTALYVDKNKNVWVGSELGFLYKRDTNGNWTTFSDVSETNSAINKIVGYKDKYLFISYHNGITIFDLEKENFIVSSADIGTSYSLNIVSDTLFAGGNNYLYRFNGLSYPINTIKFSLIDDWKIIDSLHYPIKGITYRNSVGVKAYERPALWNGDTLYYGTVLIKVDAKDEDTTSTDFLIREYNGKKDTTMLSTTLTDIGIIDGITAIGTMGDYVVIDPLGKKKSITINGFVFGHYQNGLVTRTGELWTATVLDHKVAVNNSEWWRWFDRYNGKNFFHYNTETEGIGASSTNDVIMAMVESRDSSIWVGDQGSSIKCFHPQDNRWFKYLVYSDYNEANPRIEVGYNGGGKWSKSDGIVEDSTGLIWAEFWSNTDKSAGSQYRLIAFNPSDTSNNKVKNGSFKFMFSRLQEFGDMKSGDAFEPYMATVASNGDRYFIDPSGGGIKVPASVNPLKDSVEAHFSYFKFPETPIYQIVNNAHGSILLATDDGVSLLRTDVDTIEGGGILVDSTLYEPYVKDYLKTTVSIAVENSRVEHGGYYENSVLDSTVTTSFWAVIPNIGVERMVLKEFIHSGVVTAYLQFNNEPIILTTNNNFGFTLPAKVLMDHTNNAIWIVSNSGVATFKLDYNPTVKIADNSESVMYPNPYSLSKHRELKINRLSPNAFVDIYTISGTLVSHFDRISNENIQDNGNGTTFSWTPTKGIAPGTYLAVVKDSEGGKTVIHKLVIIP